MADLETLLHELQCLGDPIPQSRVRALLRSFVGHRIYFARRALIKPEQVRTAAAMLDAGMTRPDIARALMERLQASETTAYRIIGRALNERRNRNQMDMF